MFVSAAYAQAAGSAPGAQSMLPSLLFPLLIFLIFYFLMIRPQSRKMKEQKAMIAALRRGDQVLTQGGIIGKVTKVGEDSVIEVEIADGVKVKVLRHTIATVMNKTEPALS
jgi:preprotein translocase subunit YajC